MSALVIAAGVVLLALVVSVLRWAARHVGGSTPDADAFMDHLHAHPSRGIYPGAGR